MPGAMAYNARMTIPLRDITASPRGSEAAVSTYETDFYSWTRNQAEALRCRAGSAIDWDNVIEEIESLGKEQRNKWTSTAAQAVAHMLKIQHWRRPPRTTVNHWQREAWAFRREMADTITKNPGLQGEYEQLHEEAWQAGRDLALDALVTADLDSGRGTRSKALRRKWQDRIPTQCPWTLEAIVAYDPTRRYRRGRRRPLRPDPEVWPAPVSQRIRAVSHEASGPPPRPRRR